LNEKWGQLHQDKLQSCIRQHRLVRDSKPDISAIHKAYCALIPQNLVGEREVEQTRNDLERCTPISAKEFAEWDVWAEAMLKNVTNEELKRVNDFIGHVPESRRILAVAIEHVRKPSVRYA
jgi:hypothetical protein